MIAIASDHAGFERKQQVCLWLKKNGYEFIDLGTNSTQSVDYPLFAQAVADKVKSGECDKGILICGSGIGMSIKVNRNKGVRGALCTSKRMATLSRQHNNANVLCMPARKFCFFKAKSVLKAFLTTEFSGGRHEKRVAMLDD